MTLYITAYFSVALAIFIAWALYEKLARRPKQRVKLRTITLLGFIWPLTLTIVLVSWTATGAWECAKATRDWYYN